MKQFVFVALILAVASLQEVCGVSWLNYFTLVLQVNMHLEKIELKSCFQKASKEGYGP